MKFSTSDIGCRTFIRKYLP